ncbi:MAG: AAA family ATPase [Treponema sp.]|nr:AAA family ATPase [Treponema sp.]
MRRRTREHEFKRFCTPISQVEKTERTIYAYYLYLITNDLDNKSLAGDDDLWDILTKLLLLENLNSRFGKVVEFYVKKLQSSGKLKLLSEADGKDDKDNDESTRDVSSYDVFDTDDDFERPRQSRWGYEREQRLKQFYKYTIDSSVKNYFRFENESENRINCLRCLLSENKGTFAKIIAATFFINDYEKAISENRFYIPKKIKDMALDISKVKFLKDQLNLSESECLYLLIRYRKVTIDTLSNVMTEYACSTKDVYAKLMNINQSELAKILRPDQKLFSYGFINEEHELSANIVECIANNDLNLYFCNLIKPMNQIKAYDLDSFSVPKDKQLVMKQLLNGKNPVSILMYGTPGSGKTEFAKALIKACNKKVVVFKNESEIENDVEVLGRLNCYMSMRKDDTILVVDEADTLLQTQQMLFFGSRVPSKSKGLVNKMLEESNCKVIWIVNHIKQIEDSTRRRFTLSCMFEPMSPDLLKQIASQKLSSANLEQNTQEKILNLFSTYHITGASVDNVIKAIESFNLAGTVEKCDVNNSSGHKSGDADKTNGENGAVDLYKTDGMAKTVDLDYDSQLIHNVEIVLQENSRLLNGNPKLREKVSSAYDHTVLNTSIPAEKILKMVLNAKKFAEKNKSSESGIRMLFFGLSGSGKTEFARFLSEKLNKKILLKRASDILNKYVGENEQNIKKAFEEAAANDQILLFDEADSFFADRNGAKSSWERTIVNEFLCQMEEFPGILICTTNLRNIMDAALLRRFHITVEFNALQVEGIKKLLGTYFGSYNFTSEQINQLSCYQSVTPGDFGRLNGQIRFVDDEEITSQLIIDELCKIQKEKLDGDDAYNSRKIGFFTA